jgi:hypothetical protein
MRMLTEKGTQDAAAVKVLTVITLIYLPASAVSVSSRQYPDLDRSLSGYRTFSLRSCYSNDTIRRRIATN